MIMIMIVVDLNYVCLFKRDRNYVNLFKRDTESVVAGKLLRA